MEVSGRERWGMNRTSSWLRRPLAPVLALLLLATTAIGASTFMAVPAGATGYTLTMTQWPGVTGTLGSVTVTVANAFNQANASVFQTAEFDPPGNYGGLGFTGAAAATFTFSAPVTDPVIYLADLRSTSNGGAINYSLGTTGGTCTWSIQSGFTDSTLTGATIAIVPVVTGAFTQDGGILRCTGTISGVSITPDVLASGPSWYANIAELTYSSPTTSVPDGPAAPAFTG